MRGEAWVPAAGRPGFGEQRRDTLRHPLPHLGDTLEGPGELGRGGRRGRPGQTVAARHQRSCQGLLVGHQYIRRKGLDGGVHAGQHRAGERDEDLRPQEAQGRDAPQVAPPPVQDVRAVGRVPVSRRVQQGARGKQRREGRGGAGPGDLVAACGEFGGDGDRRVDVSDQRRDDEQHPHPVTAPAGAPSRASTAAHRPSVASLSTVCPTPGSTRSSQSGAAPASSRAPGRSSECSP